MTEKKVWAEILQMYRDFPCLWDQTRQDYNNREIREQTFDVLLDKYKRICEDATVELLKKKIENMRTCYRREHKKVLAASMKGMVYKPSLWYYNLMGFLDENFDISINVNDMDELQESTSEYEEHKPKLKRKKVSTIFIPEEDHDETYIEEMLDDSNTNNNLVSRSLPTEDVDLPHGEPEAFGKTIGLQLKELNKMQRCIAEKLISDVIFYGRLEKLHVCSTINVQDE